MAIDITKHFGTEVRKYRKDRKLTKAQLAELSHLSEPSIDRLERVGQNISIRNAYHVAQALQIPLYKFFLTNKQLRRLDRRGEIAGTPVDQLT